LNNIGISSMRNMSIDSAVPRYSPNSSMTDNRVDRNTASKKVVSEAESSANENKQVSEEELIKVIEKANETIKGNNAKFEYSIHDDTKRIMVKVINPVNDEVIREIPSEKILDMVAKIWEMTGILVDEKR